MRIQTWACTVLATTLSAVGLVAVSAPAQAALTGSTILYQCGTSVCAIDPDLSASNRVIATNARPAGLTRDGRTAGVVDRTTQVIREVPLVTGGLDRIMATPGPADPLDFASISDSGATSSWVWFYAGTGWYAETAPAGGSWTAQASSTAQLSVGWKGEQMLTTRRGAAGYDSRICLEVGGGPVCDQLLASEPDRSLHVAFPDIDPTGTSVVAVRGPESSGFGLPYYGSLVLYPVGTTTGASTVLTTDQDSQPEFSYEGTRVVFERQNQGIWVINTDGTGLRRIADGTSPFWGGARQETPDPTPTTPTPTTPTTPTTPQAVSSITIGAVQPVRNLRTSITVIASCPAENLGGCVGSLSVRSAKKLRVPSAPRKVRVVIAKGRYDAAPATRVKVRLKLTKKGAKVLRRTAKVKAVISARATVPAGTDASTLVTIKRRRR